MGFINPAAFWSAVFIGGLVVLYLWERNRRRFDVPSLFLWEAIPEAVTRRSRFQPDYLFWLQLAVLSALMFGLANPYLSASSGTDRQTRAILVLDLSASMQAIENKASRLELARDAAVRVVQRLPEGAEAMLIAASRQPTVLVPFTEDRDALVQKLVATTTEDTASNLEPALAIAQRTARDSKLPTEIHVVTDIPREWIGDDWLDGTNWWPIGSSDHNVAIESIEITQGVMQDHSRAHALITVRNFSRSETHGSLSLAFDGTVFSKQLFTIGAQNRSVFRIETLPRTGLLEARLSSGDALPIDDRAFAWIRPFRALRIAATGKTAVASALGELAAATRAIEVVSVNADEALDRDAVDVLIHQGQAAESKPNIPSLTIASAETPDATGAIARVEVLDWNENHPILRGIDPQLLHPFTSVANANAPSWAEPVLDSQIDGDPLPILLAGERDRVRHAFLNVDLERENLLSTDRETTLLLFLNLLDWLSNREQETPILRTGSSLPLPPNRTSLSITDPRGTKIALPPGESADHLSLDFAGRYSLEGSPTLRQVVANFQDSTESDIGRPAPVAHSVKRAESADEKNSPYRRLAVVAVSHRRVHDDRRVARSVEQGLQWMRSA